MDRSDKEKWIEIAAVIVTGLLRFVMVHWLQLRVFYITAVCLLWLAFILIKFNTDPEVLKRWGFRKHHLSRSFLFLLPFGFAATVGIVIYGLVYNADFLNWHILPVLTIYPLWGLLQQFVVVGLVAGNLKTLKRINISDRQVIFFTALLFALVHYPYLPLMLYAFAMEVLFIGVYFKWRNLWSLALFHGWVSGLFLFIVMERDLWNELFVIF